MGALSLMVVEPWATRGKNGYPKSGMSLFTKSLGELKTNFSSPPVVKFAELDRPFEVHTGVNDFANGGLLMEDGWALYMGA